MSRKGDSTIRLEVVEQEEVVSKSNVDKRS